MEKLRENIEQLREIVVVVVVVVVVVIVAVVVVLVKSERIRTHPSRSIRIRIGPNMSGSFQNLAKTSKNFAQFSTKELIK